MADKPGRDSAARVLELFEEGRKFTEDLLKENERLRAAVAQARIEIRDLENRYIKVDVARLQRRLVSVEDEVAALREENAELKARFQSVEDENREFADRYVQVERQNSDLVTLYVASQRLHSTLDYHEVVEVVKEIVVNLVGSEAFAIYVVDASVSNLVLVGQEGMDETVQASVPIGAGILGESARSGQPYVVGEGASLHAVGQEPIACIPLKVGSDVVGVIAIYALLKQKRGFHAVDLEMFELLGGHAGSALYVSSLYAVSERKRNTLEELIKLLKTR
ncbi:MAG: GAF domain-containing protein [Deltaproteobacteria bacterium]|nr:GAF domain-containing protein [Deltaproteobacteria bacterium]